MVLQPVSLFSVDEMQNWLQDYIKTAYGRRMSNTSTAALHCIEPNSTQSAKQNYPQFSVKTLPIFTEIIIFPKIPDEVLSVGEG